ncbi:MAG: hypothetical protein K5928_06100 [Prevotella sp.]|nr:hypothetical protein [Prevotella sp.]
MKKTYISPDTATVSVESIIMNSASTLGIYSEGIDNESELLGRGHSRNRWDDEEEY